MEYKVLSNLKHDGTTYVPGEVVEMEKKEAEGLVGDGVLEPIKEKKVEKEKTGKRGRKAKK